jgi:hypothetical protein
MWIVNANDNTVTKMRVTDGFVLGVYAPGTNLRASQ